jgi:hypothetical protein
MSHSSAFLNDYLICVGSAELENRIHKPAAADKWKNDYLINPMAVLIHC